VVREGFLKDKCGPRAKTFEHHWCRRTEGSRVPLWRPSRTTSGTRTTVWEPL